MSESPQDHQSQPPSHSQQPGPPVPPNGRQAPQYSDALASSEPKTMSPSEQRTWAMATHLSPFLAAFVALSFLGPLILYIVLRDRGPFVRRHAAEALNFQLTMWIGLLVSFALMFLIIGFFTAAAIGITMLICHILAAVAASEGRDFRYPLTIRFVS